MSDISFTTQSHKHIKQNSFITFQQNLLILNYVNYICYLSHYLVFLRIFTLDKNVIFLNLNLVLGWYNGTAHPRLFCFHSCK